MKDGISKVKVFLVTAIIVIIVILIVGLNSQPSEIMLRSREVRHEYSFDNCFRVGKRFIRCENKEVICYRRGKGLSCGFKHEI